MRRLVLFDGKHLQVRPKTFDTLVALVESNGDVLHKDDLMRRVWGGAAIEESGLARNISELRKLLGETPGEHRYIVTVPGIGYRFVAPVSAVEQPARAPAVTRTKRRATVYTLALAGIAFALALTPALVPKASLPPVTLRPLTANSGFEADPSFSPDGKTLAYSWTGEAGRNLNIYVKAVDDGAALRLTRAGADDRAPAWSPDGQHVAFLRYSTPSQSGVFIVPASGGSEREVLRADSLFMIYSSGRSNAPGASSGLAWYPDGKSLAVAAKLSGEKPRCIVALSIDTGEKRGVTSPDPDAEDSSPAISPDGKTLAFVRSYHSSEDDIFLTPAAGGRAEPLVRRQRHIGALAWAPDGHEIVFSSDRGGAGYGLWHVSLTGREPQLLAIASRNAHSFTLNRATGLAFMETSVDTNIWRLEVTPGAPPDAVRASPVKWIGSGWQEDSPQFSPDGQRVAFVSNRAGCQDIWIREATGAPRRLTSCFGSATGTPRWSPDGRKIAFDAIREQTDIFVVDAQGGIPRRLTGTPPKNVMPSWSRDGQWIYFRSVKDANSQIWKVPAVGGVPVQVTRNGGFEGFESPDGRFLYFTKDRGLGGIWRVPPSGGEETAVPELADAGYWRYWTVRNSGIYFVRHAASGPFAVCFYAFGTRRVTQIASLDQEPQWWVPGLDVSPDERSILYLQADLSTSTIMLVRNFHLPRRSAFLF